MAAKSRPRPGPALPQARCATIFPHREANSRSSWRSWGDRVEVDISAPALELRQLDSGGSLPCSRTEGFLRQSRSWPPEQVVPSKEAMRRTGEQRDRHREDTVPV